VSPERIIRVESNSPRSLRAPAQPSFHASPRSLSLASHLADSLPSPRIFFVSLSQLWDHCRWRSYPRFSLWSNSQELEGSQEDSIEIEGATSGWRGRLHQRSSEGAEERSCQRLGSRGSGTVRGLWVHGAFRALLSFLSSVSALARERRDSNAS